MGEHETHEVELKLQVTDEATGALGKIREKFGHWKNELLEGAKEGFGGGTGIQALVAGGVGGIAAMGVEKAIESVKETLHEVKEKIEEGFEETFEAGVETLAGRRQIEGILTLVDQAGTGFETLSTKAGLFKDDLEDIGVEAGVDEKALTDAFSELAERTNKSAFAIKGLTEDIAYAGKLVQGGPDSIAYGFEAMAQGVVRARNPVVALIAATGKLHGNAKQVAAQLSKMTPNKQMQIAEDAIKEMGEKAKKLPPTWENLKTSAKGFWDQVKSGAGVPLVQAVLPQVKELEDVFLGHKDEIIGYAKEVGSTLADWGKEIGHDVGDAWNTLKTHSAEIKAALKDGAEALEKAGTLLVEGFGGILKGSAEVIGKLSEWYGEIKAAFEQEHQDFEGRHKAPPKPTDEQFGVQTDANLKALQDQFKNLFTMLGPDQSRDAAEAQRALAKELGNTTLDVLSMVQDMSVAEEEMSQAAKLKSPQVYAEALKEASDKQEIGALVYAAQVLIGSEALQKAFQDGSMDVGSGIDSMLDALEKTKNLDLEKKVKDIVEGKGAPAKIQQNNFFSGGVHVNVDMRDQDPDRVFAIFERDLVAKATARTQARTVPPFSAF